MERSDPTAIEQARIFCLVAQERADELLERSIATEPDAVSELWWRIGERVMARLRQQVGPFAAERATSRLMGRILDDLPGYDALREPLSHWLDAVVDRYAIDYHVN